MMRVLAGLAICCAALTAVGCGSGSGSDSAQEAQQAAERRARVAADRWQARLAREARQAEARARRQAARRRANREAARRRARRIEAEERRQALAAESQQAEAETSNCDPSYEGACLDPYASDYDCEGGSGDGPEYTGQVTVVGSDRHGLDSDGDGVGCEPY